MNATGIVGSIRLEWIEFTSWLSLWKLWDSTEITEWLCFRISTVLSIADFIWLEATTWEISPPNYCVIISMAVNYHRWMKGYIYDEFEEKLMRLLDSFFLRSADQVFLFLSLLIIKSGLATRIAWNICSKFENMFRFLIKQRAGGLAYFKIIIVMYIENWVRSASIGLPRNQAK